MPETCGNVLKPSLQSNFFHLRVMIEEIRLVVDILFKSLRSKRKLMKFDYYPTFWPCGSYRFKLNKCANYCNKLFVLLFFFFFFLYDIGLWPTIPALAGNWTLSNTNLPSPIPGKALGLTSFFLFLWECWSTL